MKASKVLKMMVAAVMAAGLWAGCEKKTEEPATQVKAPAVKAVKEAAKAPAAVVEKAPEAAKAPEAPAEKSKAEMEKMKPAEMTVDQLKAMATECKDNLALKDMEMIALKDQLKEIPATELLGEKAKSLKDQVEKLAKEINDLKAKQMTYISALKDKKVDVKGLE